MPMVARDIRDYLGKEAMTALHPEYAVAEGAAVQAGMISGEIDPEDGLIMTDVNPYTLGVRTNDDGRGDHMSVVIPRNVTIPVTRTERYHTSADFQTVMLIEVYQGESMIASHNHLLGKFPVRDVPPRRAGEERVDISFSYDLNGMLKVSAKLLSTGAEKSIEIDMTGKRKQEQDLSRWKEAEGAKEYRTVIRTAERLLAKEDKIPDFMGENIRAALDDLKRALIDGNPEEAREAESWLQELIEEVKREE